VSIPGPKSRTAGTSISETYSWEISVRTVVSYSLFQASISIEKIGTLSGCLLLYRRHPISEVLHFTADASRQSVSVELLVVYGLRYDYPLDAGDTAKVPAGRQPELSLIGGRSRRWRNHYHLLRPGAARWRWARKLDPDRARQELVGDPPQGNPAIRYRVRIRAWSIVILSVNGGCVDSKCRARTAHLRQ